MPDTLGQIHGIDLSFPGDLVVRGSGDLVLTAGLEGLRQAFLRSLGVSPGGILWRPDYGIGIRDFINRPATAANVHEMKNRIRTTLGSHPAVDEIKRLDVIVDPTGPIGLIEVRVELIIASQNQILTATFTEG